MTLYLLLFVLQQGSYAALLYYLVSYSNPILLIISIKTVFNSYFKYRVSPKIRQGLILIFAPKMH